MPSISLILTSINRPNSVMQRLAEGARKHGWSMIIVGDTKSPSDFALEGAEFLDMRRQLELPFRFAHKCPTRHYTRKNIGYLVAMARGTDLIVETDDDNFPLDGFFAQRERHRAASHVDGRKWTNVYRYFTDANIWPRGLPLDEITAELAPFDQLPVHTVDSPVQQGLADANPDVDAIYRLALPLPIHFRTDRRVSLGKGNWCPFNSQNTTWWPDAYPLLYLPAHCSFRMTDIWRSFIAQRIMWENNWFLTFHEPTVEQDRNDHNLMKDFEDEVAGYLNNASIAERLAALPLASGVAALPDNMRLCYEELVRMSLIGEDELSLLDLWLDGIRMATKTKMELS